MPEITTARVPVTLGPVDGDVVCQFSAAGRELVVKVGPDGGSIEVRSINTVAHAGVDDLVEALLAAAASADGARYGAEPRRGSASEPAPLATAEGRAVR